MELPVCRWRGDELSPGRYACRSPKLLVGAAGVTAETCVSCYCCDHECTLEMLNSRFRIKAGPHPGDANRVIRLDCVHRGPATKEVDCEHCKGRVRLKVFACAKHQECTIQKKVGAIAVCAGCQDYQGGKVESS